MNHSGVFRFSATVIGAITLLCTSMSSFAADDGSWPYWRGPSADGMAVGDAPLNWSDTENVRWKTDIPGLGISSPVVWGDRIFVTTAIKVATDTPPQPAETPEASGGRGRGGDPRPQGDHKFNVLCLDRKTGKILWEKTATIAAPHEGFHRAYGSFASNSPVTDGKYVYAFFGSRGMYCYDMEGKPVWQKDFGVQMRIKNSFGEGIAPVLSGDRLILLFDHEGDSFIVALDKATGKEIWRTPREERTNWATPLVVDYKRGKQVVVSATSKVRSYDLNSGKLLWECGGLGSNTIPQPVIQDDLVYVMSGHREPKLMAIRLGKEGDLTGTDAVVWNQIKGIAYTASPVISDNKLYVLTDSGKISCYNARTGDAYYQETPLPKPYKFKASPVGANGKLYLASENGNVIVLRMGEKFEVLATNTMPDQVFLATPAIAGGEIILRSKTSVYCVG
jgi:outer membrane protein assembly factor BamB